jgi:peptidoglycan biosynthesis protein MviN/MurJ (putative lipid II flippase)
MRLALVMVILNISLNLSLIWSLREAGLGWSTAICAAVQCMVLLVLTGRFVEPGQRLIDNATAGGIARTLAATAAMGISVWSIGRWMPRATGWTGDLIALIAMSAAGGILFVVAARLLHCHELRWLLSRATPVATPKPPI